MANPFFAVTEADMSDSIADSLKKINRLLYLTNPGGVMPEPFYGSLDAEMSDSMEDSVRKINQLIANGAGGGGGGVGGVYSGNGSPEGVVVCASGSCVYVNKDDGSVWSYVGVAGGDTGWA